MSKLVQICLNRSKIGPNWSKLVQFGPNGSIQVQISTDKTPNGCNRVKIGQKGSKQVQIGPYGILKKKVLKLVQIYQNGFKWVQMGQNRSKSVKKIFFVLKLNSIQHMFQKLFLPCRSYLSTHKVQKLSDCLYASLC